MLPYPIPLALSGDGGGLLAAATIDSTTAPFPVAVDTGTILTTFDDGSGQLSAHTGDLVLFGVGGSGGAATIPRLSITDVQVFTGPLGTLGVGSAAVQVGGVIGGDNLSRFAVGLDYRGTAPTMTLVSNITPCSCELQPTCEQQNSCFAVLPFSLVGGQDTSLQSQTRIILGNNQYSYPPTRVLLDACVEPFGDPVASGTKCVQDGQKCPTEPAYLPSGVDMQFLIATGFPGMALSANAYDRLRGAGAANTLLSGPLTPIHLVDAADEATNGGAGVMAATTTLGSAAAGQPAVAPLALVSREIYFGPCASLARSRRIREAYIASDDNDYQYRKDHNNACIGQLCCLVDTDGRCPTMGGQYADACKGATSGAGLCSDGSDDTPAPAVIELKTPINVYVLADLTPLLVGINGDVRPTVATVDGIVGTALLSRLVSTIDYPGSRFIAQCAREDDCVAYPRLSLPSLFDCGFCRGPKSLTFCVHDVNQPPGLRACPPAQ